MISMPPTPEMPVTKTCQALTRHASAASKSSPSSVAQSTAAGRRDTRQKKICTRSSKTPTRTLGVGSSSRRARWWGAVELLWPLLRGESAVEPERVTEKLRQSTFWQGRGGAVEHAISGIDIALWDMFGKVCDQPVSRLLGGNYRERIKPYALDPVR